METIKSVTFLVSVGERLFKYQEILEEIRINIDENVIDLTKEDIIEAEEDSMEPCEERIIIDLTKDEEDETPLSPIFEPGEDVESA